jgi:hypothetical protein
MPTEIIVAVIGLLGIIAGSIPTYLIMRQKGTAEVDKLKAEADKTRAETEKIRKESRLGSQAEEEPVHQEPYEISVSKVERALMTNYYIDKANQGSTIEIITLTLQVALENYGEGRFLRWIQEGKQIRILVLSPFSMATKLRSREENSDENFLANKIIQKVELLKNLYNTAGDLLEHKNYAGSMEVRFYDGIPYFAYFRTENSMAIGLYYSHIAGLQSEVLLVDTKSSVYENMKAHFERLWNKGDKQEREKMTVCVISKLHMHFIDLNALREAAALAMK